MSDNISQLHPQKHPGLGKRIAVFAVLLVFVTAAWRPMCSATG